MENPKKNARFTVENFMAIHQVMTIFEKIYGEEVHKINRGNYDEQNLLVMQMVDFGQRYFPILRQRTQDGVGIQISICVEACYKNETNWGNGHLKYKRIYKKIHDNEQDIQVLVNEMNKRLKC